MANQRLSPIPFTLYDILGYLLPGFFLLIVMVADHDLSLVVQYYLDKGYSLAGIELECGQGDFLLPYLIRFVNWHESSSWLSIFPILLLLILCFLIGHIIAALSSTFIEKFIFQKLFRFADDNLFKPYSARSGAHSQKRIPIISRYQRPLADTFLKSFKKVINKRFRHDVHTKEYFWLCYAEVIRKSPAGYSRIQHWVNLYGFARNTATVFWGYFLFKSILLGIKRYNADIKFYWFSGQSFVLLFFLLAGFILFLTYVKFYRRMAVDLFLLFYSINSEPTK